MKGIVRTEYGVPDVLALKEVEKPAPDDNEVWIGVHVASVDAARWHFLRTDPFITRMGSGLPAQKYGTPGADIAGRVEAVFAVGRMRILTRA